MADRLKEIRARANAATPGPWHVGHVETTKVFCPWPSGFAGPGGNRVVLSMNAHHPEPDGSCDDYEDILWGWDKDAAFVAHAREDIPWLCAEVQRLQRETAMLWESLDECPYCEGSRGLDMEFQHEPDCEMRDEE